MRRRTPFLVALVWLFVVAPPANAIPTTPLPLCDGSTPAGNAPCVVAVTHEGSSIPYDGTLGAGHDSVVAVRYRLGGTHWFHWWITDQDGHFALIHGDTYSITINTGTVYPGETFARGHNEVVRRTVSAGQNIVTFTQEVVRTADQGCNGGGLCNPISGRTNSGYLDGWIDDLAYVSDADDRAAMHGFDLASNVDWVSSPLELDFATNSIVLRVANSHFEGPPPSTTPFTGFAEFKLPFAMLNRLYDVTDPASLGPSAFSVIGAGAATTTVDVSPTGHTVRVQIEGMRFSKHKLRIRGTMRPSRPGAVQAIRTASTRGKLTFLPAKPHGSRVIGYTARCESAGGRVVTGHNNAPPVKVAGLLAGVKYVCAVRAKSRWGMSYRAFDRMPRTP